MASRPRSMAMLLTSLSTRPGAESCSSPELGDCPEPSLDEEFTGLRSGLGGNGIRQLSGAARRVRGRQGARAPLFVLKGGYHDAHGTGNFALCYNTGTAATVGA